MKDVYISLLTELMGSFFNQFYKYLAPHGAKSGKSH